MQAAPDAEQARRPIAVPPAVLAGLPPAPQTPAQQAVVAAREASQRKQWSVLGALAPQARTDPLGMYPEYWLLRYQLWSPPGGRRPDAELQRFLAAHAGSYLEDRLRGDWIRRRRAPETSRPCAAWGRSSRAMRRSPAPGSTRAT